MRPRSLPRHDRFLENDIGNLHIGLKLARRKHQPATNVIEPVFDGVIRKAGCKIAFEPKQIVNRVVELPLVESPKDDLVAAFASQNLDGTLQFRIDALDHGIEFVLFRPGLVFRWHLAKDQLL